LSTSLPAKKKEKGRGKDGEKGGRKKDGRAEASKGGMTEGKKKISASFLFRIEINLKIVLFSHTM